MKKNEMNTLVSAMRESSNAIVNKELAVKKTKKELRVDADRLVNSFMLTNDVEGLKIYLTNEFQAMDAEGLFGIRGIKMSDTSTKDMVTYRMESLGKLFHRSFNDLKTGQTFYGYNPFQFKETTAKKVKLPVVDQLKEYCENLGMDIQAVDTCVNAYVYSDFRKYESQASRREELRKEKELKAEQAKADKVVELNTTMLNATEGMTIEQMADFVKSAQALQAQMKQAK